jgi:hypothetical protein
LEDKVNLLFCKHRKKKNLNKNCKKTINNRINSVTYSGWVEDYRTVSSFQVKIPFYAKVQDFLELCKSNTKNINRHRVSIDSYKPFQHSQNKPNCKWNATNPEQSIIDAGLVNGAVLSQNVSGFF